jgi:hypothetical protein
MQRIVCFLALVAICFSQTNPQIGPFTAVQLVNGVPYPSVILPSTQEDNYDLQFYQFYVPANASSVNINLVNLNDTANPVFYIYVRSNGLPCSTDQYNSDFVCYNSASSSAFNNNYDVPLYPGVSVSSQYEYTLGGYIYIAIGRYYGSYYQNAASYILTATLNVTCNGINYYQALSTSNDQICGTFQTVTTSPQTFNATFVNSGPSYSIFKNTLPNNVGNIFIVMNSTSNNAVIYGNQFSPPSTSQYNCYTGSSTQDMYGFYIYNVYCYTPRAGDFWVAIYDSDAGNSSYTVTFNTQVCSEAMMQGGFNCTYVSQPLNTSSTVSVYMVDTPASLTNVFSYFYYDIPANFSGNQLQVSATAIGSSAYIYYRKGGYSEDSSTYGYDSSNEYSSLSSSSATSFTLGNFDYFVPGRYYFGIECYGTCNITLAAAVLPPSMFTTGNLMTTGSTTAAAVTTGMVNTTLTTMAVTTGMVNTTLTTNAMTNTTLTTRAVTSSPLSTRGITSGQMTTGSMSTTGDKESSDVVTLVPSFVFAIVLALIALF